ncbi:MAG TPA: helix-turn-helix transcriptional regulator [Firmicutes bacterium]|nr:helix-turn-helix transcriptional regulator [Bacillota bacterium]
MEKVKRLNLDQLKLLAHPLRQRILVAFAGGEPLSVQELAGRLKLPHGKVYYHVQRLAEGGILSEVGQRTVNGIVERLYEPAAASFTTSDEELRDLPGYRAAAGSVADHMFARVVELYRRFQQVRQEREKAATTPRGDGGNREPAGFSASFVELHLTAEEEEELARQLQHLFDRYRERQRARQGTQELQKAQEAEKAEAAGERNAAPLRRIHYVVLTFTNLAPDSRSGPRKS